MDKAVFIDRDGTVIVDRGYLREASGVALLPGAADALTLLAREGYLLVLITNQSGIGRGYFTAADLEAQHARLVQLLAPYGVAFAGIYVCPHAPGDGCECRKPEPGLILRAGNELQIDLAASFMVGDKESDVAAGRRAGCTAILLHAGGDVQCDSADAIVADLGAAARFIAVSENEG